MVTRAARESAVAHSAQLPAERLLGDRDAELLEDPLCKIDQPPTHHAMDCRNRTTLDHTGNGLALNIVEPGRLARRLTVQQTVRPMRVEAQHPVPDNLEPDPANSSPPRCASRHHRSPQEPEADGPGGRLWSSLPNCGAGTHRSHGVM